jgi:hypothetical protein
VVLSCTLGPALTWLVFAHVWYDETPSCLFPSGKKSRKATMFGGIWLAELR